MMPMKNRGIIRPSEINGCPVQSVDYLDRIDDERVLEALQKLRTLTCQTGGDMSQQNPIYSTASDNDSLVTDGTETSKPGISQPCNWMGSTLSKFNCAIPSGGDTGEVGKKLRDEFTTKFQFQTWSELHKSSPTFQTGGDVSQQNPIHSTPSENDGLVTDDTKTSKPGTSQPRNWMGSTLSKFNCAIPSGGDTGEAGEKSRDVFTTKFQFQTWSELHKSSPTFQTGGDVSQQNPIHSTPSENDGLVTDDTKTSKPGILQCKWSQQCNWMGSTLSKFNCAVPSGGDMGEAGEKSRDLFTAKFQVQPCSEFYKSSKTLDPKQLFISDEKTELNEGRRNPNEINSQNGNEENPVHSKFHLQTLVEGAVHLLESYFVGDDSTRAYDSVDGDTQTMDETFDESNDETESKSSRENRKTTLPEPEGSFIRNTVKQDGKIANFGISGHDSRMEAHESVDSNDELLPTVFIVVGYESDDCSILSDTIATKPKDMRRRLV